MYNLSNSNFQYDIIIQQNRTFTTKYSTYYIFLLIVNELYMNRHNCSIFSEHCVVLSHTILHACNYTVNYNNNQISEFFHGKYHTLRVLPI